MDTQPDLTPSDQRKNRANRLRGLTLKEQLQLSIELEGFRERSLQRTLGVERALGHHRRKFPMIEERGGGDDRVGSRPRCSRDTWELRAAWGGIGVSVVLTILGVYALLRWLGW